VLISYWYLQASTADSTKRGVIWQRSRFQAGPLEKHSGGHAAKLLEVALKTALIEEANFRSDRRTAHPYD